MVGIEWKFKPSLKNLLFILICLGTNFLGKTVAVAFVLPFWFDSIGTCFAAVVLGPLAGALVGFVNNILNEVIYGGSLPYIVVSIMIGVVVGIVYPKDNDFFQIVFTGFLVAILSIALSAPLNVFFYEGSIGNKWGDALFDMLSKNNFPASICGILGQIFIEIPDKSITLLLVSLLVRFREKSKINKKEEKEI